jgi:uncharacterized protein
MDTGFVMAVVNDKDQYHSDAVKLANRFRNYPMVITDAVLLEIGNSLARCGDARFRDYRGINF